jgi:hypothetical protein
MPGKMGSRGAGSRRTSSFKRALWAVAVLGVTFLLMFSCNAHNAMGAFEAAVALLCWSILYVLVDPLWRAWILDATVEWKCGTAHMETQQRKDRPTKRRFTGQERDEETGLDFFQARYTSTACWAGFLRLWRQRRRLRAGRKSERSTTAASTSYTCAGSELGRSV